MKVLVVGGVAGGASVAARVRRLDEHAEIIMFERGEHVSFSNCCLPYYLSDTIEDAQSLVLMNPDKFETQHNIDARVFHEVIDIKRKEQKVVVKNVKDGTFYEESYDKLVLSPGANPILPRSIEGIDLAHVHVVRNVKDIVRLKVAIKQEHVSSVAVVGGGFIGIEVAENVKMAGKQVTLIEGSNQIMAPFDYDMVQILHKELDDHGIDLHVNSSVYKIDEHAVYVKKQDQEFTLPADVVVMAVGVAPETTLAQKAGLQIGETKGIKVNHNYQTSDPDIYAVGDAIESFHALTHRVGRLPLAGVAQRQARAVADHIYGRMHQFSGFIGSSCIRVFEQNAASTGLNEKMAKQAGYQFDSVLIFPSDKVGIMPDSNYMVFKLVFEIPTGKILGAQAIGTGAVDKRIDVIATMIKMNGTLEDLKEVELCYSPVFSTAKDPVNLAALVALNVLYGDLEQVHVDQVRELMKQNAYIIDIREEQEFASGHLVNAINIPLSQLRNRLDEIKQDVPIYVHCRSAQRSYYASRILKGNGFKDVKNISGSFLGISLYEYFNDKTLNRTPIVTTYNFK